MDLMIEELTCLQEDTDRPISPLARSYEKVFLIQTHQDDL